MQPSNGWETKDVVRSVIKLTENPGESERSVKPEVPSRVPSRPVHLPSNGWERKVFDTSLSSYPKELLLMNRFQFGYRPFHCSHVLRDEDPYLINGVSCTRTSVLAMHPEDRLVAHWSVIVDWDLQRSRQFVIVDPLDPTGLLYLNQKEYLAQTKVCASNDLMLIVVARPGTKRPVPSSSSTPSQNSPWGVEIESKWSRNSRLSWRTFLQLRDEVGRIVTRKKGSKMVSESHDTIARTVYCWVRTLAHYAEVKNSGTYVRYFIPFVKHLQVLLENNGQMAAVQHLKVTLFALYSYVSGNPLDSTTQLGHGVRLRNGLPAVWSVEIRDRIRKGEIQVIRLVASLLNLYRAMDAKHPEFDVSTIIKPHPDFSQNKTFEDYQKFCREVFPAILKAHIEDHLSFKYVSGQGHLVRSAGANISGPAMGSITLDALAWFKKPNNHILEWFKLHNDTSMVNAFMEIGTDQHWQAPNSALPRNDLISKFMWATRTPFSSFDANKEPWFPIERGAPEPILGRLHAIDEPAGKVRIVAICDYWTQVAMKPVHNHLFQILGKISTDATFDQTGRVEAYFQKGLSPHWSFDLKAATDYIPLALYKECLAPLLSSKGEDSTASSWRVNLWASIMTDRDFLLPDISGLVRYGTGQPMGALSSWASMAIVHHSLVQFAAFRSSGSNESTAKWYENYIVLGDDIDISCSASVATEYQTICNDFSITIGLLKSLRSEKNVFEFANQRYCPGGNISPISIKEELSALTWTSRLEFAKRIVARFGTSLKDRSSALLRKASTHAQWKVLGVELSGLRPSTLTSLFRFCLLTPFDRLGLKGLRIGPILDWLAPVVLSEDKAKLISILGSEEEMKKLEREVAIRLLDDLEAGITRRLAMLPGPFTISLDPSESKSFVGLTKESLKESDLRQAGLDPGPHKGFRSNTAKPLNDAGLQTRKVSFISNEMSLRFPFKGLDGKMVTNRVKAIMLRVNQLFLKPSDGGYRDSVGDNSFASLRYIMFCVSTHNKSVMVRLEKLLEVVSTAAKKFPNTPSMSTAYDHAMMMTRANTPGKPEVFPHPFTEAFRFWDEFNAIPQGIVPNPCIPSKAWLGVEEEETPITLLKGKGLSSFRTQRKLEERLRAPMRSIELGITSFTGVHVPDLPYQLRQKGGNWTKALREAIRVWEFKSQTNQILRNLDLAFAFADALEGSEYPTG